MGEKNKKVSLDISPYLYKKVMDFAHSKETYKFGPTVISMLEELLTLKGINNG